MRTKEEHAIGVALMSTIAIVLVLLLLVFAISSEKQLPINYIDGVVNEGTKNIS